MLRGAAADPARASELTWGLRMNMVRRQGRRAWPPHGVLCDGPSSLAGCLPHS